MNNLIKQTVKVPHRSGHYLGHHFMYTANVGEIVPILCHPVIPNTRVRLKTLLSASLAPLATDTFLRTSMRLEAFAVPLRFLYGGYEQWAARDYVWPTSATTYANRKGVQLPRIQMTGATFKSFAAPGKLLDYLGVRFDPSTDGSYIPDDSVVYLNYFPIAAYHYIVDTWYRRADLQMPFFRRPESGSSINTTACRNVPYIIKSGSSASDYGLYSVDTSGVGSAFFNTRQRNFPVDYFTSAMVSAQLGDEESITVDTSGSSTAVSVASIRAANSLQVWRERQGMAGVAFTDWLQAQYGTTISDSNGRRPIYLGSGSLEFYSKGVDVTGGANIANSSSSSTYVTNNNPFKSPGATFGKPASNGTIDLVDDFTANEPMYIVVMATCVPKVMYSSGVERYMLHYTKPGCEADLANPILQNVGNQEIKMCEVMPVAIPEVNATNPNINSIFGFTQRYQEYMYRNDRLSGKFRDGQSLSVFAAQRYLGQIGGVTPGVTKNTISDAFLQIPVNYLDQVSATSQKVSDYGCMVDCYFDFAVSQPLYDSSIPSLVNPSEEHGKNVVVMRGGKRIV